MKCLHCDGTGEFIDNLQGFALNKNPIGIICSCCKGAGMVEVYTEQVLKDQCSPEFIKGGDSERKSD